MNAANDDHRPRRRHAGFTIIHMVIIFPLLGVFMVASSQLFLTNHATIKHANQQQLTLSKTDAAVHRLRLDALAADRPPLVADHAVLFQAANRDEIHWKTDPAGDLVRTAVTGENAEASTRRYTGLGDARFEETPGGLVLILHNERFPCPTPANPQHDATEDDPS